MTRRTVAVIGSANADLVVRVDRRPGPGETLSGSDLVVLPGGKGANQAVAAARAGAETSFCGCVGDDAYAATLRRSLTEAGVDLDALASVDAPTGTALVLVTPDGENSIVVSPGANARVDVAHVERTSAHWVDADVVVLDLEVPLATVAHAAATATGRVLLNAAPAARLDADLLASCDPLVVNEHEARAVLDLGPDVDEGEALDRLLAAGARSVVLTLGGRGAVVATAHGRQAVAALTSEVVDSTGAGDCFVGALAAGLAAGDDLVEAARYANAAAALSVRADGAQPSYPHREAVLALLSGAAPA